MKDGFELKAMKILFHEVLEKWPKMITRRRVLICHLLLFKQFLLKRSQPPHWLMDSAIEWSRKRTLKEAKKKTPHVSILIIHSTKWDFHTYRHCKFYHSLPQSEHIHISFNRLRSLSDVPLGGMPVVHA